MTEPRHPNSGGSWPPFEQQGSQQPAYYAPPPPERPWYKKKRFIIPLGIVAFIVIVAIFAPAPAPEVKTAQPRTLTNVPSETTTSEAAETTVSEPAPVQTTEAPELSQEAKFIALIESARENADNADGEFQKRLALTKRDKSICKLLKSKSVKNWTGEVTTLDTNGDGLGVLEIEIADDIKVGTWNNALSDFEDNTLIKTDSSIFETMSSLSEGDQVTFSGTLIRDSASCIGEQSVTDIGSTQTPTFTMRFSQVAKS